MFTRPVFNVEDFTVIRIVVICVGGDIYISVLLLVSYRDRAQTGPD